MISPSLRTLNPYAPPHFPGYIPTGWAGERPPWDVPCIICGSPAGWLCVSSRIQSQRAIARHPCPERVFASRQAAQ